MALAQFLRRNEKRILKKFVNRETTIETRNA
jgi:hypothetical protein